MRASRGVSNGRCSHRPFVIIRNPSRFTKGAMKVNFGEDDVTEFTFRTLRSATGRPHSQGVSKSDSIADCRFFGSGSRILSS